MMYKLSCLQSSSAERQRSDVCRHSMIRYVTSLLDRIIYDVTAAAAAVACDTINARSQVIGPADIYALQRNCPRRPDSITATAGQVRSWPTRSRRLSASHCRYKSTGCREYVPFTNYRGVNYAQTVDDRWSLIHKPMTRHFWPCLPTRNNCRSSLNVVLRFIVGHHIDRSIDWLIIDVHLKLRPYGSLGL